MNSSNVFDGQPRWRRLVWFWVGFWLLMFCVGLQESLWAGPLRIWRPLVNVGSAALAATALAVIQIKRANRLNRYLGQPLQWFIRMWAWMPLQMIAYVVAMYALRVGMYRLGPRHYEHGPWLEVMVYDATNFLLFFALFNGIHFGLRSYRAWVGERFFTERQINLARQTQLTQLTQQLQPHFLFNALNTISSLIHSDPDSADRLLTQLAILLRAVTEASQRLEQPLADEIDVLRAYAAIMAERFSDRAAISWNIDPAAQHCRLPTLGLQPLVENCFHHVVEQRSAMTHIWIRASCQLGQLTIEIEDDGDLEHLPEKLGVGLGNLRLRLQSLYGNEASLDLLLRSGGGLTVRMRVPCAY